MSRDHKVNVYQWTPRQCERLAKAFELRHVSSSAAPFVRHLLPAGSAAQDGEQLLTGKGGSPRGGSG